MIQIFLLIRNICSEIFHLTLIRGLILLIELQIILVSYSRFLRRLRIILLPVSHRALCTAKQNRHNNRDCKHRSPLMKNRKHQVLQVDLYNFICIVFHGTLLHLCFPTCKIPRKNYSTVTLFARFLGLSTSSPFATDT